MKTDPELTADIDILINKIEHAKHPKKDYPMSRQDIADKYGMTVQGVGKAYRKRKALLKLAGKK